MSWTLLAIAAVAHGLVLLLLWQRRGERRRDRRGVEERARARERGSHEARLQYPHVDLSRCIGCGSCVAACPEEGVLDLIHGQAVVVHGARCVGHSLCAAECPTGAIAVTLGAIEHRRDIPVLTDELEVPGRPGLFLAGEVTGYSLIRTAVSHGTAVAETIRRRLPAKPSLANGEDVLDLCIVGLGPAGLACSLRAKELGLRHVALERDEIGGTVAKYPRRKLVMTQPVELPGHGRLERTSYSKEELMELWREVEARHELPVRSGEEFVAVEPAAEGVLRVKTRAGGVLARNVVLALGRRGLPRKLGVPGEELPKVGYGLLDARSYGGRRTLVVGGGDSAVEAALALSEQRGTSVTLSYRKAAFTRIKAKNETRLERARARGRVEVLLESEVLEIRPDSVSIVTPAGSLVLANDDVFVLIGGEPPFRQLEASGVSFDPAQRELVKPPAESGKGLRRSLASTAATTLAALVWVGLFADYYLADAQARTSFANHDLLRPAGPLGLAFGIAAAALVLANLAYLARRARLGRFLGGSLRAWMSVHIATGILAFLLALLHSAMAPAHTVGGHAFAALGVLVVTGAIGRYLYAWVPRSANGRELLLDELRPRIAAISTEWDATARGTGERFRAEIEELVASDSWRSTFAARLMGVFKSRGRLRRTLERLTSAARADGLPDDQIRDLADLSRRAYWTSYVAAHLEDLRGILASWRFLHRWVALLMFLLLVMHVVTALRYGGLFG